MTPGPIQRLESFEMVRSAAAAGLGVAILNVRPPSDTTYSGMNVTCRPLDTLSKRTVHRSGHPPGRGNRPACRSFRVGLPKVFCKPCGAPAFSKLSTSPKNDPRSS